MPPFSQRATLQVSCGDIWGSLALCFELMADQVMGMRQGYSYSHAVYGCCRTRICAMFIMLTFQVYHRQAGWGQGEIERMRVSQRSHMRAT